MPARHFQIAAATLLLALTALPATVRASESIAGIVVERDGQGVDKADVHFYGENGRDVGHARSNREGRFTAGVSEPPETWSAAASGFETRTLRFTGQGSQTIVLYPRDVSTPAKIDGGDFAVLPYQDAGYVFSLVPFSVIQGGGSIAVGDRGLSGSANQLQGNGTTFGEVPARYLAFAAVADALHSYRYSGGSAGHYTLGFDRAAGSAAEIGAGSLNLTKLQSRSGDAAFGFGTSSGDLTRRSRFDAVGRTHVGSGKLLATAGRSFLDDTSGANEELGDETASELRLDEPWLGSTATFSLKAKRKAKNKISDYIEADSEVEGEFRLRSDGGLFSNETGVKLVRDNGVRTYPAKVYSGDSFESRVFAAEDYNGPNLRAHVSLSWYNVHDAGVTHKDPAGAAQAANGLAAAIRARWQLTDRFAIEASRGNVIDTPSVSDQFFGDPIPGLVLNRSNVTQGSLLYRSPSRFEAEVTSYSERYATALPTTSLSGFGAAIDWPIAREWRLRAWTLSLRDAAAGVKEKDLGPSFGRDVAWLTYYGARGARFDAIYRRETDPVEAGRYLDADAAVALGPHITLMGTMERHHMTSSYGLALSFETPHE